MGHCNPHTHGDGGSTVEKTNAGLNGSYRSSLPHPARQSSADVQSALVYRIGDSALGHCEMLSSLHTRNILSLPSVLMRSKTLVSASLTSGCGHP